MDVKPTEQELRDFINAMLSNFDKSLREPEIIDETIRDHRGMWEMLWRAGIGTDTPGAPSQAQLS